MNSNYNIHQYLRIMKKLRKEAEATNPKLPLWKKEDYTRIWNEYLEAEEKEYLKYR